MNLCSSPIVKPLLTNPILLFVNPASGGGLGLELMSILSDVKNLFIVQLPAEQDTWYLKYSNIVNNPNLRAVVAGGDGSVNWVVKMLSTVYNENEFRPPLAVIPFGTGNDMSRNLGWGGGISKSALLQVGRTIENMANSDRIETIDVWTVAVQLKDKEEINKYQMINYISFGVDGNIARDYEIFRRATQPLLCCQCMSQALFVPAGAVNFFGKRSVGEYMSIDLVNLDGHEGPTKLKTLSGEKTIMFLSSKTVYAGKTLWRGKPAQMDDGKLEVVMQGGVWAITFSNIGINLTRSVGQTEAARIETSEPTYYQIDGEAMNVNGPATFDIVRTGSYPFLHAQ
ncbi:hypothetical protein TRFO_23659 [Tritrichomonas foetus]|uniref:Diacylglycerol kinase n=1 Tax=Tritrichomonas foetus TaxID=1144522 RepID=A0A1J4K9X4_9EUKA|nr:hypothetical protein TRFO_23659 [Tritrichomonas foetus]|eukprot:OHT08027.1 hypothetical protein TRFO_23659 [Tritrichomonas foetus]